jgi:hypothetical protein
VACSCFVVPSLSCRICHYGCLHLPSLLSHPPKGPFS